MLIYPGNHLGDTWYYVKDDLIHCFYLTCPDNVARHTAPHSRSRADYSS